jgi:hypothetical protein
MRGEFDIAEKWYQKALAIEEQLENQLERVKTLGLLGVLEMQRGQSDQGVFYLGRAWNLAVTSTTPIIEAIAFSLAICVELMGEINFIAAWQKSFRDQDPPLEAIRQAAAKQEQKEV